MRKSTGILALSAALLLSTGALAAEEEMKTGDTTSMAQQEGVFGSSLNVGARAGWMSWADDQDDVITGLTLDWNMTDIITPVQNLGLQAGLGTGLMWSPLSSLPDGTNTNDDGFIVPANVFVGYGITQDMTAKVRGGINWFPGDNPIIGVGAAADEIAPTAGVELGYGLMDAVGLTARGDMVFADGDNPIMATLGVVVPLG